MICYLMVSGCIGAFTLLFNGFRMCIVSYPPSEFPANVAHKDKPTITTPINEAISLEYAPNA